MLSWPTTMLWTGVFSSSFWYLSTVTVLFCVKMVRGKSSSNTPGRLNFIASEGFYSNENK